ncbi:hypothetical protein KP509_1Z223000 [Ceratopteris richardii]|nr:hypothetical protein KP509_1Z223000 [Ceratopteris richardii]
MAEEIVTLTSLIKRTCAESSNSLAIVTPGGPTLTYAQLDAAPGDIVAITFPNSIEFIVTFLAAIRARAIVAPLNSAYTEEKFLFYLEDSRSVLIIVPASGNAAAENAAMKLDVVGVKNEVDDESLFLHTSGTTIRPKGVPLTQLNLSASIQHIIQAYELGPNDRTVIILPLFHVHGLMAGLLSSLVAGGTVVLPSAGRFSATSFWDDMRAHGATWYTAVPTVHQILLEKHKAKPESSYPNLRFIHRCKAAFGALVLEAYAMIEASHQMCSNPLPAYGSRKPGCVGKPTGIKLAILDDEGRELPSGQVGDVCIKGLNMTKGYKNNPNANKVAFAFGWFHTGDREVDAVLLAHPAVAQAVGEEMTQTLQKADRKENDMLEDGADANKRDERKFIQEYDYVFFETSCQMSSSNWPWLGASTGALQVLDQLPLELVGASERSAYKVAQSSSDISAGCNQGLSEW